MHDADLVFAELDLAQGDSFLDLGCGPGDYALRASDLVGEGGAVYALDSWPEMIEELKQRATERGLRNVSAMLADITLPLPLADDSIDTCFAATVLHALDLAQAGPGLFGEVHRVLKPGGQLAVIECKKEEMPFGPPLHMRLSPEDVERLAARCGFEKAGLTDLGYNYMIRFIAT